MRNDEYISLYDYRGAGSRETGLGQKVYNAAKEKQVQVVYKDILKYICANFKGKFGENLYPEELRSQIDQICEKSIQITDFTVFILREFPEWLQEIEEKLSQKYIISEKMTMADIHIASFLLAYLFNETYENCHIL